MRRMYTKKNINNPVRAHVTAMPIGGPFERISTDILDPLPVCTSTKNKYLCLWITLQNMLS